MNDDSTLKGGISSPIRCLDPAKRIQHGGPDIIIFNNVWQEFNIQ